MPFDGIAVSSVCYELNNILINSKIDKIFQPEKDTVIIVIRAKTDTFRLLLSINSNNSRIHLTKTNIENPPAPPMFCMLLRKHLCGGKIIGINQYELERIVEIVIESTDILGEHGIKKLIIEMMGKHSNIMLVDNKGTIIDSIKRVDSEMSRARQVLPGIRYNYPPSHNKVSLSNVNLKTHISADLSDVSAENFLLDYIMGFGRLICNEICINAGVDKNAPISSISSSDLQKLQHEIEQVKFNINHNKFTPCVLNNDSNIPIDFYCFGINSIKGNLSFMDSINEAADIFYTFKIRAEKLNNQKTALSKNVLVTIDKCTKRLEAHQEKLNEVSDFSKLKLYGELIYANMYDIKHGQDEAVVPNYYEYAECGSENVIDNLLSTITIPLDKNLSPSDNANLYFKKYNKAKNALLSIVTQIGKTINEIDYLVGITHTIENCENISEIENIKKQLSERDIIPIDKTNLSKREIQSLPMKYISSDGFTILVGKNNKQNDSLTLNTARKNDIWLHAQKIPGSHVIIKSDNRTVSNTAILEAAMLAAYYSKARNSSNVSVDYTEVKNVKKPSGAKPGAVVYNNFNTLLVSVNKQAIEKLRRDD